MKTCTTVVPVSNFMGGSISRICPFERWVRNRHLPKHKRTCFLALSFFVSIPAEAIFEQADLLSATRTSTFTAVYLMRVHFCSVCRSVSAGFRRGYGNGDILGRASAGSCAAPTGLHVSGVVIFVRRFFLRVTKNEHGNTSSLRRRRRERKDKEDHFFVFLLRF